MQGQKHLIQCKCILPQFKGKKPPIFHSFIVFSELDVENNLIEHYELCNNCNALHKIKDICTSELIKSEEVENVHIISEDDIKRKLPGGLISILESNSCELYTWKEVLHIYRNQLWGSSIILQKEESEDEIRGKLLKIYSKSTFKLDTFKEQKVVLL